MATSISESLRHTVALRADHRCEYCRKPMVSFFAHEVDHVIAQKHRGETTLDNLAFACFECNRHKGSDIASIDPETQTLTPLFNPRTQSWKAHFRFDDGMIIPLTAEGRVTVLLLHFNDPMRIQERNALKIGK